MNDTAEMSAQQQDEATAQDELAARVVEMLRTIYDPEIPVNIVDLGLVYGLEIHPPGEVHVIMTLTAPGCPVAQSFPESVKAALLHVEGVSEATVELVWEPIWGRERMSELARFQLGLM
jgi:FeS assembly SUF system protein